MNYRIILWRYGEPSEVHLFNLEHGCKSWYTSAVSIGSFDRREKTKLYKAHQVGKFDKSIPVRCSVKWGEDLMFDILYPLIEAPEFEHATVWDFYKAIGYDYKKQKYNSVEMIK